MYDVEMKPRSLNDVWEIIVANCRRSYQESEDDDHFYGIFEGQMLSLAILSLYMGKLSDYVELCEEFEGLSWTF